MQLETQEVPFTICRPRRASGQCMSKGLRIMKWMSEVKRRWVARLKQISNFPFLCIFVLFRLSMDLTMPAHKGEGTFFTHNPHPVLVSSRSTLIATPGNGASPAAWASLSSVKSSSQLFYYKQWCSCIIGLVLFLWIFFGLNGLENEIIIFFIYFMSLREG